MVFDLLAFPAFKTKYELLRLKLLACLYLFSSILLTNYLTFFAKHSSICDFYDPVPSIHHFFGFHCTRRIRRRVYFNVLASTRPTSIEVLQIISGKKCSQHSQYCSRIQLHFHSYLSGMYGYYICHKRNKHLLQWIKYKKCCTF